MGDSRQAIPPGLRWEVLKRDGFQCRYCGAAGKDSRLEIDHVTPVSRGGKTNADNLVTACFSCNRGKGAGPAPPAISPMWARLISLVPQLVTTLAEIQALRSEPGYCISWAWYGANGFRQQMVHLVGWGAHHRETWVNSMEAYDCAYRVLFDALPDCWEASCVCA